MAFPYGCRVQSVEVRDMNASRADTGVITRDPQERGSILVWAMMFVVVTSGMVISHSLRMSARQKDLDTRYDRKALAQTVAQSGVVDAVSFFRSRPVQPVTQFAPAQDPFGDPPRLDTIDASLGLVREFEIRGNLWGRYELRREDARDVTAERGAEGVGKIWELELRSYVYRLVDPTKPFDQAPNHVVAAEATGTEVRNLAIVLPAQAPLIAQDPDQVEIGPNVIINGGPGPGLAFGDGPPDDGGEGGTEGAPTDITDGLDLLPAVAPAILSPDPTIDPLSKLTGNPPSVRMPTLLLKVDDMFGLKRNDLGSFADVIWDQKAQPKLGDVAGKVVFVPGNLDLDGTVIRDVVLIVGGKITSKQGAAPSVLSGVIFAENHIQLIENVQIEGVMLASKKLELGSNNASDPPILINSNVALVQKLQTSLQRYRASREKFIRTLAKDD